MGDTEILETYLNSGSKNTSEADIFFHETKSLLTSVIIYLVFQRSNKVDIELVIR